MSHLLAFLFLSWIWDRVLTNCHGGPESIGRYELMATQLRVTRTAACVDDQGRAALCDETVLAEPIPFRWIPDPGVGTDVAFAKDPVGDPSLLPTCDTPTCVTAWPWWTPVVAVDRAGNRSTDPCP